jgi:predicted PurR-regulated permease PerM
MLRKLWNNPYAKTTIAIIFTGSVLLMVNRAIRSTNFATVFQTINQTLSPVYIGILLAFLLCPIYNKLVRWIYRIMYIDGKSRTDNIGSLYFNMPVPKHPKKTAGQRALTASRVIATVICMTLVIGIVTLISTMLLPSIITSVMDLINTLPEKMQNLSDWGTEYFAKYPIVVKAIQNFAQADTSEIIAWAQKNLLDNDLKGLAETVSTSVVAMVKALINVFVGILISVYLLNYKEKLFAIGRKITNSHFSAQNTKRIYEFFEVINVTFIGFIIGRIIDACIIGCLTYVCMLGLELPMPELISVIVGVTNVIPFFGPFLGAIPSACLILLESPRQCLYFCIMILIIQQLDGNVIGPKVVGSVIGLSSFWVLIAVLLGGGFFGFAGMALGVPVFAVIYRYVSMGTSSRLRRRNMKSDTWDYADYSKYEIEKEDLTQDE